MTLPGETLATGAPSICPECDQRVHLGVSESAAGHFVAGICECGPAYSRESGYYDTRREAMDALLSGEYGRV